MIKSVTILRPSRLDGQFTPPSFIPTNSKEQLMEVDMGFSIKPLYKQEKICYFLPENIFYQKLSIVDGKSNPVKDDARTIVLTGKTMEPCPVAFTPAIYPRMPDIAVIDKKTIYLHNYPEKDSFIVIRDQVKEDWFHQFSCHQIIYRIGNNPIIELRYLQSYRYDQLSAITNKWHPTAITRIDNLSIKLS